MPLVSRVKYAHNISAMATDQASTSACERGGGRLVSTEFEASKIAAVQASIAAAGLSDLVELRAGDSLQTPGD
jgi:predicted O-methyltransferase YrrM